MTKHRNPQSPVDNSVTPAPNPFAALESLRGSLPAGAPDTPAPNAASQAFAGKLVINRERSGRGGKTVTVLRGLQLDSAALESLLRELRKSLGTSGGVEESAIVLGGDQCDRLAEWLRARGARQIVIGN